MPSPPSTPDTEWPDGVWSTFVENVTTERIRLGSLLQHARPHRFADETATVAVPDDFHRDTLKEQRIFLREHIPAHDATRIEELRFVVDAGANPRNDTETASEKDPYEVVRNLRAEHPVVRALFDTFDGELVYR